MSFLDDTFDVFTSGVDEIKSVANTLHMGGLVNAQLNLIEGRNPLPGLMQDIQNLKDAGAVATSFQSGGGSLLAGFNALTKNGAIKQPGLVPPPGGAYQPGAVLATPQNTPGCGPIQVLRNIAASKLPFAGNAQAVLDALHAQISPAPTTGRYISVKAGHGFQQAAGIGGPVVDLASAQSQALAALAAAKAAAPPAPAPAAPPAPSTPWWSWPRVALATAVAAGVALLVRRRV
jgi:hypothetical protein